MHLHTESPRFQLGMVGLLLRVMPIRGGVRPLRLLLLVLLLLLLQLLLLMLLLLLSVQGQPAVRQKVLHPGVEGEQVKS